MEENRDVELQFNIHGPTQKYYYLKTRQAERFAKKILNASPYEPDKAVWQELWTDAQHFMRPKPHAEQFIEFKSPNEEEKDV